MHVIQSHLTRMCLALAATLTLGCRDSTGPGEETTPFAISRFTRGTIEITLSTTGASVDIDPDGYLVMIGGWYYVIAVNGTTTLRALPAGRYSILLGSVANNCLVTGINPSSVDVIANQASAVWFSVSCATKPVEESPGGWWDY